MRIKVILLGLIVTFILMGSSSATSGFTAGPAQLAGSGTITLHNTGDTPLEIKTEILQVMLQNNDQVLIPSHFGITVNPGTLTLQPGEVRDIQVTVPDTNGMLYGVRFIATPPGSAQVGSQIAVVTKIASGNPTEIHENMDIQAKYLPITLSGLAINVKFNLNNTGNVPMTFENKTLYPGDSGSVVVNYPTGLFDMGFKEYSNGVKVFVFPSWVLLLALVGGIIMVLRRKINIELK